jgi:hypothetical protein
MSRSPIVDADYRLHVADLADEPRQVIIANVTYQGVEEMVPVLHFEGQTKRLVLNREQAAQLLAITGTVLHQRWIGLPIILQPPKSASKGDVPAAITIRAVGAKSRAHPMPVVISEDRRGWYLALVVVGLLLSASTVFALLNLDSILATLQLLRDNWLPR